MKFFILMLITLQAFAQADNICDVASKQIRIMVQFKKRDPNYFFKVSPNGENLFYIGDSQNWMLNTKTGVEIPLTGFADPVPSADGKILTEIIKSTPGGYSVGVQNLSTPWKPKEGKKSKNVGEMKGSYQSVGPKRADGSRHVLYFYDRADNVVVQKLVERSGKYTLLPDIINIGLNAKFRLPMMSPDGTMVSVLDEKSNRTQIYRIDSKKNTTALIATLPLAAGKASFSYDNKKITFHLTRHYVPDYRKDASYDPTLGDNYSVRNVYTYDIETQKITQITDNVVGDSYYPVFLESGEIAYIYRGKNSKYKIIASKPKARETQRKFQDVKSCYGVGVEDRLSQLGELWAKICKRWPVNADNDGGIAMVTALNMSSAHCRKLAKQSKDKELEILCDALDNKKTIRPVGSVKKLLPVKPFVAGLKIFQNRCAICHEETVEVLANSPEFPERVKGHGSNRMPPSGPLLTGAEVKQLSSYLKRFVR